MKLHNSLTKNTDNFTPQGNHISIYSCGPTVYNNLHIGNLSAFIYADLLRRVLKATYPDADIKHVMNITDVDDKTIRDSKVKYPSEDPMKALITLTKHYEDVFMEDSTKVGNDLDAFIFIRATDSIQEMQELITELHDKGIAYITDDGVYFSIEAYQKAGKVYGQLVELEKSTDTKSRIANDEYEKDSANDFALWKVAKDGEPSWEFELNGQNLAGRPGWHIECSAMSRKLLGDHFDMHTGGIDLKFPHHENEIAQSTACTESPIMAKFFVHNDHMLVDGVKMSKSLDNFYTLRDVEEKGYDPIAFRLLVLQGHYSNSVNFSWENLEAAQKRLHRWKRLAVRRWQIDDTTSQNKLEDLLQIRQSILLEVANDLSTPQSFTHIEMMMDIVEQFALSTAENEAFIKALDLIDAVFGLRLLAQTPDISDEQKKMIEDVKIARMSKDYLTADKLRDALLEQKIELSIGADKTIWSWA